MMQQQGLKVVLDAGHGPETPGKRTPDGSMREYHFNAAVARYAAEMLEGYEGVQTLFVHEDVRDVPLAERTGKANAWGADVYVSIHANASGEGSWSAARGIETFVHEGRPPAAVKLAGHVQRELIKQTGLPDRGVKTANFHVLRATRMTAILVECGFMTSREDAELLKTAVYRRLCAVAIVAGIAQTYGLIARTTGTTGEKRMLHFKDVPAGHWAADSIAKAAESGLLVGVSAERFGLGEPITREQLAVILDRAGLLRQGK